MKNLILVFMFLTFISCGGSGGGGGTAATPTAPTVDPVLSLSVNTIEQNDNPTLTLTTDKDFFDNTTTVKLETFSCSSLTINSATNASCVVDANSTGTIQFGVALATTGSTEIEAHFQVVLETPITETYVGVREDGNLVKFDALDDQYTYPAGWGATGYRTGTTDLVTSMLANSGGNPLSKCLSFQWDENNPNKGAIYIPSNRTRAFTNDANYAGIMKRIVVTSASTATVQSLDWDFVVTSSENLTMFCNTNNVTYLYSVSSPRISPAYVVNSGYQLGDLTNSKAYVSSTFHFSSDTTVSEYTSGAYSNKTFDGKTYESNDTVDTHGGIVSLNSGQLCDTGDVVINGDDERTFIKGRESGSTLYYQLHTRMGSGPVYTLKGVYEVSANGSCLVKQTAVSSSNVGLAVVASDRIFMVVKTNVGASTITIDNFYALTESP